MSGGDRKIATFARTGSRSVEGVVRRAARHSSRDDPAGTELLEHLEDQVPAVASDSVVVAVVAYVRDLSGEPLDDLLALLAGEQCADRVALDRAAQEKSMGAAGRRLAVGGEALVFGPACVALEDPDAPFLLLLAPLLLLLAPLLVLLLRLIVLLAGGVEVAPEPVL